MNFMLNEELVQRHLRTFDCETHSPRKPVCKSICSILRVMTLQTPTPAQGNRKPRLLKCLMFVSNHKRWAQTLSRSLLGSCGCRAGPHQVGSQNGCVPSVSFLRPSTGCSFCGYLSTEQWAFLLPLSGEFQTHAQLYSLLSFAVVNIEC